MPASTSPTRQAAFLAPLLLAAALAGAQTTQPALPPSPPLPQNPTHDDLVKAGLKASPEAMEWWRDAKFGLFIHWGVGVEKRHAPWSSRTDQAYWDNLFANLKHVRKFNAEEWIGVVKSAGGRYVVMTTRLNGAMQRRPGGNLLFWDSQTSDNKLTHPQSPFRRDVCKEIADAAHKLGIELEWYHAGLVNDGLRELLTNYGPVRGVWFDGGAPPPGASAEQVYRMMRQLQPGILHNGGIGGKYGGDYDTPQHDPGWPGWHGKPVETATFMPYVHHGYWYWDRPGRQVRTLRDVVVLLMQCVGSGGGLTLNLGPRPDGSLEPNEVNRFREVGAWLTRYGRSVYATRPGPWPWNPWGVSTRDKAGNTLYVHMLDDLDGGRLELPNITCKVLSASLLNNPAAAVAFEQSGDTLRLAVPRQHVDKIDTIIALTLDAPAMSARLAPPAVLPVSQGKPATATSTFTFPGHPYINEALNGPANAVDGDPWTFWCSHAEPAKTPEKPGEKPVSNTRWLQVDLGRPTLVDRAVVSCFMGVATNSRTVQQFLIECKTDSGWQRLFDSSTLPAAAKARWTHSLPLPPTTARFFRLGVTGPETTVREFQLYSERTAKTAKTPKTP